MFVELLEGKMLIEAPPACAGGERLAQDRDQRLQGRQRELLQPGGGGGLHVWRPHRPQGPPVGPRGDVLSSQGEGSSSNAALKRERTLFFFWFVFFSFSSVRDHTLVGFRPSGVCADC